MEASGFLGREAELDSLDAFIARAVTGFSALVVEGEPGIGKTTLWWEGIRRAEGRGFAVLSCRPAEAEAKLSFAALADLVEAVSVGTFESLPSPQRDALNVALLRAGGGASPAEPRAVAAGLRGVLVGLAVSAPVLVAIDDGQWLDGPSADALAFALRRIDGERVGVLATRRPPTRGRKNRLEISTAQLIELDRLSLAAIHELLKRRLGRALPRPLLVRLYEICGGNPFFALEIAREVLHPGPPPSDRPASRRRLCCR